VRRNSRRVTRRPEEYGAKLVQAVWHEALRQAILFGARIFQLWGVLYKSVEIYFLLMDNDLRKSHLNNQRLWLAFCASVQVGPQEFCLNTEPIAPYADFVVYMVNANVSQHLRQEAQPVVQGLYHAIGKPVDMAGHHFLSILPRNTSSEIESKPRHMTMEIGAASPPYPQSH
jgi:hypothetical protein